MDVVVNETAVEMRMPQAKPSSSQVALHMLLFVVTVVIVIIGLRTHVVGGITAVNAVAFGLATVWALGAVVTGRFSDRSSGQVDPYPLLIAADSLLAAVALAAGRLAQHESIHSYGAAKAVATIVALLVTAVSFHLLLALPNGQLSGTGRRTAVVVAYVAALAAGLSLVIGKDAFSILEGGISWSIAAVAALIPLRLRHASAVGHDRERLQWFAIGAILAGAIALVVAVLHVLINWPRPLGAVAAGSTVLVPSLDGSRHWVGGRSCGRSPSWDLWPWCPPSTSSSCSAWATSQAMRPIARPWAFRCWRPVSQRSPSPRPANGSWARPPDLSMAPGKRRTRSFELLGVG